MLHYQNHGDHGNWSTDPANALCAGIGPSPIGHAPGSATGHPEQSGTRRAAPYHGVADALGTALWHTARRPAHTPAANSTRLTSPPAGSPPNEHRPTGPYTSPQSSRRLPLLPFAPTRSSHPPFRLTYRERSDAIRLGERSEAILSAPSSSLPQPIIHPIAPYHPAYRILSSPYCASSSNLPHPIIQLTAPRIQPTVSHHPASCALASSLLRPLIRFTVHAHAAGFVLSSSRVVAQNLPVAPRSSGRLGLMYG